MRPTILLLLSLTAFLTIHFPAAAVLPAVISNAQILDNTCQCECCYQISEFRTECLSPDDAFFDVPSCSHCTVAECNTRFPTPCSQPSSVVNATCTAEHGAFFRLVPALFVLATIALLIYGFFFKKYDGYHREHANTPVANQQSRQYDTFHNNSTTSSPDENTNLLARQPRNVTSLPTIKEEHEITPEQHQQPTTSTELPLTPHIVHDDTDVHTTDSEVATVDTNEADPHARSVDVQHAAEATPTATFERRAADTAQLDTTTPHTEIEEQSIGADHMQPDANDELENVSTPGLSEQVMNTETTRKIDSKSEADEDDEPTEGDVPTGDAESHPIQQAMDTAKDTEEPETAKEVPAFEDQTPAEGHSEPVLLDTTEDNSGVKADSVYKTLDIDAEPSLPPQPTGASRTGEELETDIPRTPEPASMDALVIMDERRNLTAEIPSDPSAVARTVATKDLAAVQSELKPAQNIPVSGAPYISMPDEGIEETVEIEDQIVVSVSEDRSTMDIAKDTTAEEMQLEHAEPVVTMIPEVHVDPSVEAKSRVHPQDVPSEAMYAQEILQERRAPGEKHSPSPGEVTDSSDPSAIMADTVTEAMPDPAVLSENESTEAAKTTAVPEMSEESALGIDVALSSELSIEKQVSEYDPVEESKGEGVEPVSDVIEREFDNSEQVAVSVEHVAEGDRSHEAPDVEAESPFADLSEPAPESQKDDGLSAPIDNCEGPAQTETLPPSDAKQDPVIDVSKAPIEDDVTVVEPDLLPEASELGVQGEVITPEDPNINVSDQQFAPIDVLPGTEYVTSEPQQSQPAEDLNNEHGTVGERVAEAEEDTEPKLTVAAVEAEPLETYESKPLESRIALAELDPVTSVFQTEEIETPGAARKDDILGSLNEEEQPIKESEVVAHDSDLRKPPLSESTAPEATDSLTVDEERELRVSDTVASEQEGTGSEDGGVEAHQREDVVEAVTGKRDEPASLGIATVAPDDTTQELVNEDSTDAGQFEQSTVQQETEQSAVTESIDAESSITGILDVEKAVIKESNTELDMAITGDVEKYLHAPENDQQLEAETHDQSEIEREGQGEPKAVESAATEIKAVDPDAVELLSQKPEDVLPLDTEPESTGSEAVVAVSAKSSIAEPATTAKEVTEAESMSKTSPEPLNIELTLMESAVVEPVTVEREIAGPASVEIEVRERDTQGQNAVGTEVMETGVIYVLQNQMRTDIEPMDSEAKATVMQDTPGDEAVQGVTDLEATGDEAKDSDQESEANVFGTSEISKTVRTEGETEESVVEASTPFEDAELIDVAAEGSDPSLLLNESDGIHSNEEAIVEPGEVEQQESAASAGKDPNEDDAKPDESRVLEVEAIDPTAVCRQGTKEAETVEEEMIARPEDVESPPATMSLTGNGQEPVEPTQESVEPTQESVEPTQESVEPTQESVEPTQESVELAQEPVGTTQEPVEPTQEPAEPTQEPVQPTQEPVQPTQEPVQPTQEPVGTKQEPVGTKQEPVEAVQEPVEAMQEPVELAQEPAEPTQESVELAQEPVGTTQEPIEPTQEPAEPTQEPVQRSQDQPTQEPAEPTQESVEPTQEIVERTQESVELTQESAEPTQESVEPTQESVEPTQESVEPTQESVELAQEPVGTTQEPAEPTQESAQPTQEPAELTQESVEPTQDPVEAMQEPVEPMQESVQPTQEPAELTQESAEPTEESVQPTQESVQPTQEPIQPTQEIVQPTQETVELAQELVGTTQEPIEPTQEPAEPTQESAEPTQEIVERTQEPAEPTQETVQPTQDAVELAQELVGTTQEPIEPTQESAQPTQEPVGTTQESIEPTQEIVERTQEPAELTQESAEPTQESVQPTQESVQPTQEPVQPRQETVQPAQEIVEPAQEPVQPAQESVEPTQEPVELTQEPVELTQEPVELTQEPVEPTQESAQPTQESAQPTQEPAEPTQESVELAQEPVGTTQEIVERTQEPVEPAQESVQPAQEPVQPTQDPVQPTQESVEPTQEPVELTQEPAEPTQESVEPTQESVEPTQEPVQPTQEPVGTTQEPVGTTQEIVERTQESVEPAQEPVGTTQEPVEPTQEIVELAQEPVGTTQESEPTQEIVQPAQETVQPAQEHVQPTQEPVELTQEPVEAMQEPVEPMQESVEPTQEPVELTQEPAEPTQESAEPTQESVEPTQESAEPTQEPAEPTQEPVELTREPAEPTQESAEPAQESVEPTQEPVGTTQEPVEAMQEPVESTREPVYSRTDGPEFAEISSAETLIMTPEAAEAEGIISEIADRRVSENEVLSMDAADIGMKETPVFDEKSAKTQVVEQDVAKNALDDSKADGSNVEMQETLKQGDKSESRTDECGTNEAAANEAVDVDTAQHGDASISNAADALHSDEASEEDLLTAFPEGHDATGVGLNAAVIDPEAAEEERDQAENSAPECVMQSGCEAEVFEHQESSVADISESAENITFASEDQPASFEQVMEPTGPSSVHLLEELDQKIDDIPGGAVPLAELEAADAGPASDILDDNKKDAPASLGLAESEFPEGGIGIEAFTETVETETEGKVEPALTIAGHNNDGELPINVPVDSTKDAIAGDVEVDTSKSAAYSEVESPEAATPQILEVSEETLAEGTKPEITGHVDYTEQTLESTGEKELSNKVDSSGIDPVAENADQQ